MREVRAHLETLDLKISSLDFRRFCKRHGIRRDERICRREILPAKEIQFQPGRRSRSRNGDHQTGIISPKYAACAGMR